MMSQRFCAVSFRGHPGGVGRRGGSGVIIAAKFGPATVASWQARKQQSRHPAACR
jgi:hypothetical protein